MIMDQYAVDPDADAVVRADIDIPVKWFGRIQIGQCIADRELMRLEGVIEGYISVFPAGIPEPADGLSGFPGIRLLRREFPLRSVAGSEPLAVRVIPRSILRPDYKPIILKI